MSEITAPLIKIAVNPALTQDLHEVIGTYCHQVRNHLNSLKLSLYFAKRGASSDRPSPWKELNAQYLEMEAWLERLQMLCRPLQLDLYHLPFDLLIEERRGRWTDAAEERDGTLAIEPADFPTAFSFDMGRFAAALDDLAAWRFRAAPVGTRFMLGWKNLGDHFEFRWSELHSQPPESRETRATSPLSSEGLLLPVIYRLAVLHGGTVDLSLDHGWHLSIRLPSQPRCPRSANDATGDASGSPPHQASHGAGNGETSI